MRPSQTASGEGVVGGDIGLNAATMKPARGYAMVFVSSVPTKYQMPLTAPEYINSPSPWNMRVPWQPITAPRRSRSRGTVKRVRNDVKENIRLTYAPLLLTAQTLGESWEWASGGRWILRIK